jgi:hypothetical protein
MMSIRKRFACASAASAIAALFIFGGSANAQVTVGQLAPANPAAFCSGSWDELQLGVSAGASYAVPAPGGVITSWSTSAGPGTGQLYEMKVYRPQGASYTVVAHDGPRALTPSTVNTFPVSIPVQTNDILGIHLVGASSATACVFNTGSPLDRFGWREGDNPDGGTFSLEEEESGYRYNVSATVLPPPTISSISPAAGSIKGASVVIAGANFASVSGVSFGSVPATFAVDSEGQITATAPPSKTLSTVPVTVTTVAGTATSPQTFAYKGCAVPQLKGKKLKAAKKKLSKANCKLGKVTKRNGATAKTGKVTKQSPKPGKVLAPGSKVKVTLG